MLVKKNCIHLRVKLMLDLFKANGVMKVEKIRFKKTKIKIEIKKTLTIFIFLTPEVHSIINSFS